MTNPYPVIRCPSCQDTFLLAVWSVC
ncbi:MAG: hypothetical protein RJA56_652, partial [Pseudomonadota bacterium]